MTFCLGRKYFCRGIKTDIYQHFRNRNPQKVSIYATRQVFIILRYLTVFCLQKKKNSQVAKIFLLTQFLTITQQKLANPEAQSHKQLNIAQARKQKLINSRQCVLLIANCNHNKHFSTNTHMQNQRVSLKTHNRLVKKFCYTTENTIK